jgi:hypothetical protein
MRVNLDEIQPSEIHLRERTLWSLLVAHKQGRTEDIPPIKVMFDNHQGQWVIWDGNTRAYAQSMLGHKEIEVEVVGQGAPGTDEVLRGAQACRLRGIRRIDHLNPIDVLPDDRWRARPIVTYDQIRTA